MERLTYKDEQGRIKWTEYALELGTQDPGAIAQLARRLIFEHETNSTYVINGDTENLYETRDLISKTVIIGLKGEGR
jgi:hypothetical protein